MKSIFRKIALVLVLAMVVTMLPAKSASVVAAAAEPNKWVRNTCTLYLDAPVLNDKYDTYVSEAYATKKAKIAKNDEEGWGTLGYTVSFATGDPSVAEVGTRYGLVTAKGIGQTTITATFSKEGEEDIVESFTVTVKSYAHSIALDKESEDAVNALVVGNDPVTLKAVVTDAEGNQETVDKVGGNTKLAQLFTERKYVTDYVKFKVTNPEDKDVLHYDAETNQLTAVAEGEATLTAVAYRWDWTPNVKTNAGWYAWRTATQEYTVTVKEAGIVKAEQTAYNAFELTFDNEDIAKAASDETSKYFTSGSAAVTDQDDIVKVYEVLKNANGEVVGDGAAVIIGGIGPKNDAKNVLSVTMFQELKQNTDYVVYYKNGKATFTTAENIAAGITISEGSSVKESIDGVASTRKINLGIFTYGANGQEVNLDGCAKYDGWRNSVTLEEIGGAEYHPDYSVSTDPSDPYVDFYTDDTKVTVTIKATLLDYFNEKKPGNPLVDQAVIHIGGYTTSVPKILAYGVHAVGSNHNTDGIYSSNEFAAEDVGMRLFVKLEDINRNPKERYSEEEEGVFTFRSANEDKLIVGEMTGELFPAKELTTNNDTVNVFVYYDGQLVGYCPIKVWSKRVLTNLTVTPDKSKMSYNFGKGIDDLVTLTVKPVDQLESSDRIKDYVSVTCSVMGDADKYVTSTAVKNDKIYTAVPKSDGTFEITFRATDTLPTSQRSIHIVCTAVYDDGVTKKTLTASTSFSAKNTKDSRLSRYDLNLNKKTVDMKLDNTNEGKKSAKEVTINVYAMDREGFKIEQLAVSPYGAGSVPTAGNYITIRKNNVYMGAAEGFSQSGSSLVFETVRESSGAYVVSRSAVESLTIPEKVDEQFLTVSGAAISQVPHMLEKAETGNYEVSLYVNGKRVTGAVLQLKDTQPDVIAQSWKQNRVDGSAEKVGGVLAAIGSAFDFKLGDTNLKDVIYVGEVEIDKTTKLPTGKIILNNDIVVHGNSVAIRQVRYLLTHTEDGVEYVYELEIPVNKTILVGVIQ